MKASSFRGSATAVSVCSFPGIIPTKLCQLKENLIDISYYLPRYKQCVFWISPNLLRYLETKATEANCLHLTSSYLLLFFQDSEMKLGESIEAHCACLAACSSYST